MMPAGSLRPCLKSRKNLECKGSDTLVVMAPGEGDQEEAFFVRRDIYPRI